MQATTATCCRRKGEVALVEALGVTPGVLEQLVGDTHLLFLPAAPSMRITRIGIWTVRTDAAAWGMSEPDLHVLDEIQRRVLWLAARIVDAANHERRDRRRRQGRRPPGVQRLPGHRDDRAVVRPPRRRRTGSRVKPHASPVFHAIQYLLGNLDRSYLTTLRARGGLQSYPSRTKDPDRVDFSTGSVGLGAAAPLFAAVTRRYVDAHFGAAPALPVRRADRRRRARRGQHLGGGRRPGDRRASAT